MRRGSLILCLAALGVPVAGSAVEGGRSDYVFSSDLAAQGFEPFAASGSGNASYGMKKGAEMYLCFIADTMTDAAERQEALVAELNGENPDREVPNIPVVCVLTQ